MCLAAKTPSTIAQQKAATAPKLMKTIDATNCGRKQRRVSFRITKCTFVYHRLST